MEDIILVGYGGHAKSVADCIERANNYRIIGYTDLKSCESRYPYLGPDSYLEKYLKRGVRNAVISIGYMGKGDLRERLYQQMKMMGFVFPVIVDPSAIISETARIGEGVFVGKGAVINAGVKIGKMCIINTGALVEHDCIVDDFTHVAVRGVLCGGVHAGRSSFIGANATVLQNMNLPDCSLAPAGQVIRKNKQDVNER